MFFFFSYLLFIRSSYFQQIEEDVQKYTKQIIELRSTLTNLKIKDVTELKKSHKDVESVLEKLTDESQVSLQNSSPFGLHCHSFMLFFHLSWYAILLLRLGAITV